MQRPNASTGFGPLMAAGQQFSVRSSRISAVGRAVLAAVLCLSVMVGPRSAARLDDFVAVMLVGYAVYSVALLLASRSRTFVYGLLARPIMPTALDFAFFTVLLYASDGANSPFFSPYVFLILSATIQWGARGALCMGILIMLAFTPAGWAAAYGPERDAGATQVFIVRIGYIFVISVLLATFGRHVERMVEELSRLSHPAARSTDSIEPPLAECLEHVLWVFNAKAGAFLWEEEDEPYATLALNREGRVETRTIVAAGEDWLVSPEVADAVFLFDREGGRTFVREGRSATRVAGVPMAPAVLDAVEFRRALVIPARTSGFSGWVLIFDHEEPANEDLAVGAMVGAQVAIDLERWATQRARREQAATEDRLRLARDLHDGVLQFLAGARLQLDTIMASGDLSPEARERLAGLREAISDEQREMRGFISTLRPTPPRALQAQQPLGDVLDELAGRLSRHWSVSVTSEVSSEVSAPARLAYDIGRIVREAVANAVRHGKARSVRLETVRRDDRLTITIRDDGAGFPFSGRREDEALARTGEGPRSLHERVRTLAGRLTLESSPNGAILTVDLPMPETA